MIAAIVLNWRGADDTIECLRSLSTSTADVTPVVVDNASGDGSVAAIRKAFPDVLILELESNFGYAGGNNRGIQWAMDRDFTYICVLNNDTVVASDALAALRDAAAGRRAAVCPRIGYVGKPGDWYIGATESEPFGLPMHDQRTPVGASPWPTRFLTGCCIFASAEVWSEVGVFDESYFLIFEDSEWSIRAREAGVALEVVDEARVLHKVSASLERADGVGLYYYTRNQLRFLWSDRPRRRIRTLAALVLKPAVRDLVREGAAGRRAFVVRAVSVVHAWRRRGGPAHGWVLRRLGLSA